MSQARQKTEEQIRQEVRTQVLAEAASTGQLVTIERGRLPYPKGLEERFGVAPATWRALTDSVFPSAKTPEGVVLAIAYCKARNLDIMKRPVHVVPIWDSKKRREIESVWEGIGSVRTTAHRTGKYAGCDPCEFGPIITKTFKAEIEGYNGQKETREVTVSFPEWARLTVYRMVEGVRCAFPGPKVRWLAAYGRLKGSEIPNDMWCKRSDEQLEKCTEVASLRRAFPEELGDLYIAEEMEGVVIDGTAEITPEDRKARPQPGQKAQADNAGPDAEDAIVLSITMPATGEMREFDSLDDYAEFFRLAMQQAAEAGDRDGLDRFWETNSGLFAALRKAGETGAEAAEGLTALYRELEAELTKRAAEQRQGGKSAGANPDADRQETGDPRDTEGDPGPGSAPGKARAAGSPAKAAPAKAMAANAEPEKSEPGREAPPTKPMPWVFKHIGGRNKEELANAEAFAAAVMKTCTDQGYAPSAIHTFMMMLNKPGMERLERVDPDLHARVLQHARDTSGWEG